MDKLTNYRRGLDQSDMAIADINIDILMMTNETCEKYLGRCNRKAIFCPIITKVDLEIFELEQREARWIETMKKQLGL